MDVIINILFILSSVVLNTFCIYFYHKMLDKKFKLKSAKNWIIIIFMAIVERLLNLYCPRPYRFVLSVIILLCAARAYTKSIKKICILVIMLELNMAISELIYFCTLNIISIDYSTDPALIVSNIFVTLISYLILKLGLSKKIFTLINKSTNSMKKKEIVLYSLMIVSIIILSTMESYMRLPILIVLITNTLIALVFIAIIVKFITTKSNYDSISNKYQISITSLKEYEEMIDKFRINNHENKNELLTIRNLTKDLKVIDYIDKLIDNKIKDNENIMNKTAKIPEGGIRATIYSKLCTMDKNNISYNLEISNDIRTVDLINISDDLILNICKILGVFMDNAIDAVKSIEDKYVSVEIYTIDKYLYIDISNNYSGQIKTEKIGNTKFTTKGKGHGYGLLLVNQIIKENSRFLENEKRIDGKKFTQSLKIKME